MAENHGQVESTPRRFQFFRRPGPGGVGEQGLPQEAGARRWDGEVELRCDLCIDLVEKYMALVYLVVYHLPGPSISPKRTPMDGFLFSNGYQRPDLGTSILESGNRRFGFELHEIPRVPCLRDPEKEKRQELVVTWGRVFHVELDSVHAVARTLDGGSCEHTMVL